MSREIPRGHRTYGVQARPHVDHRHRAQETALEFLGPAPVHLHRPAGSAGQACRLDRLVAVLAAEPDARGRDDHPDRGLAYPERFAEPGADRERDVGARPDGQPAAVPLRDGRPGLWPAPRIPVTPQLQAAEGSPEYERSEEHTSELQ